MRPFESLRTGAFNVSALPPPKPEPKQPSRPAPPDVSKSSLYLIYIDESGDCGQYIGPGGSTAYFVLSGLMVPEAAWYYEQDTLWRIRLHLQKKYGLSPFVELHGSELINPRGNRLELEKDGQPLYASRAVRVAIYREFLTLVSANMQYCRYLNLYLDKQRPKYQTTLHLRDLEYRCWDWFLQRFQNNLSKSIGRRGMVFCDETNEHKIREIIRTKRRSNTIPSQDGFSMLHCPYDRIIEDPIMRDSRHSGFIQIVDMISHALYRQEIVKGSHKRFGMERLFRIMEPRLIKEACPSDPFGIVRP